MLRRDLRRKEGPETPLQTIQRFAEADDRFKVLLRVFREMKLKSLPSSETSSAAHKQSLFVCRECCQCGLQLRKRDDGFWTPMAGVDLRFKRGAFDLFLFGDRNGAFEIKASDPRAKKLLSVWFTPKRLITSARLKEDRAARIAARIAAANTPERQAQRLKSQQRREKVLLLQKADSLQQESESLRERAEALEVT